MTDGTLRNRKQRGNHYTQFSDGRTTYRPLELRITVLKKKDSYHWLFVLVWFDTSDKEGVAKVQSFHQRFQGLLKLRRKGWGTLTGLRAHGKILAEIMNYC